MMKPSRPGHDPTLEASEVQARLAAIVESSDDAIIGKDLTGTITSWNRGAERIFGYSAEEAIGQSVTMLIPRERHDEEPKILDRIRRGERVDHYETVRRRKDGALLHISLSVSPILNARGEVVGASKIARDVSEAKFTQQATMRLYEIGKRCISSGDQFTIILGEMLEAAVWMSHADAGLFQVIDERSGALRILAHRGLPPAFLEFFDTVDHARLAGYGPALGRGERTVVDDVTTDAAFSGRPARDVLVSAGVRAVQSTPLISGEGAMIGLLSTHFARPHRPSAQECHLLDLLARQAADYIERSRGERQREHLLRVADAARREAEAANRAKDEFLAMLGHELRNPLAAVRNAVTAALLDETARPRALQIARRQTEQLSRIVDDLLDVARITHGHVPLRKERLRLADVLQRAVDGAQAVMDERGHTLTLALPAETIELEADPARLEQAVANLLANAAKYTDPGGSVTVTGEHRDGDAVIHVRDSGMGIAPALLPRIFELFTQGEQALDRTQGGLGIGLTLVRRIAELHGGSVSAKSPGPGQGSEFTLRLPALPAVGEAGRAAADPRSQPRAAHPTRVLMVEDNPDAAESLVIILELLGHHVRVVGDGLAALDAARANPPDIMLVDIGLPGMNGYEVAQAVRREPTLKHVVLVALTGYGRPEDKAQAVAAGFDYHLVKPVDLDALSALVTRLGASQDAALPH